MNNSLSALWAYQQAELSLAKLKDEVKATPSRIQMNKLHRFLKEQQAVISGIQKDLDDRNSQLEACNSRLETLFHDYELEQAELSIMEKDAECTAAELTESRRSIEKLQNRVNHLIRELNDTLTLIDKLTVDINSTWSRAAKAQREYQGLRAVCAAELDNVKPQLDAAEKLVKERAGKLSKELLSKYEAKKKNYPTPVACVENNQCSGCYMSLPSIVAKRVASGTSVVECENCGRILIQCS